MILQLTMILDTTKHAQNNRCRIGQVALDKQRHPMYDILCSPIPTYPPSVLCEAVLLFVEPVGSAVNSNTKLCPAEYADIF